MKPALVALLMLPVMAFAQPSDKELKKHRESVEKSRTKGSVVYSLDTVFQSGTPLCIMQREKRGTPEHEYTVSSFSGEKLISIIRKSLPDPASASHSKIWYVFYFYSDGKQAWLETFGLGKHEEDVIAGQKLISGNSIDASEESRFVALHPMPPQASPVYFAATAPSGNHVVVVNSQTSYTIVPRSGNGTVIVTGNTITQNGVTIGTLRESSSSEGGKMLKRYTFLLPDGTKIAEAVASGAVPDHLDLVTYRDNLSHRIEHHASGDEQHLAKFLVDGKYL